MKDIASASWYLVLGLALLGSILVAISFTFLRKDLSEEKDSAGATPLERVGLLALNGVFLLLTALLMGIIKYINLPA